MPRAKISSIRLTLDSTQTFGPLMLTGELQANVFRHRSEMTRGPWILAASQAGVQCEYTFSAELVLAERTQIPRDSCSTPGRDPKLPSLQEPLQLLSSLCPAPCPPPWLPAWGSPCGCI